MVYPIPAIVQSMQSRNMKANKCLSHTIAEPVQVNNRINLYFLTTYLHLLSVIGSIG